MPRRPVPKRNVLGNAPPKRSAARLATAVSLHYRGASFDDPANAVRLDGVVLVDARASLPLSRGLELYARVERSPLSVEVLEDLLRDPGTRFTTTPERVLEFAAFMAEQAQALRCVEQECSSQQTNPHRPTPTRWMTMRRESVLRQ